MLTIHENTVTNRAELRVRYAETDKMKVVYNGNYLTYFEVGRTELLRSCGLPYPELEKAGFLLPVLEAHVVYKMSAVYDDLLSIHAAYKLERIPTIRIDYRITRSNGEIHDEIATGYTIHPFVQAETMKPVRPPKVFFEAIERTLLKQP